MNEKIHVHFMGIGGSGVAPVAQIAKEMGYEVSGCDIKEEGYYYQKLKEMNIKIEKGHDANHLLNANIVAVSPALFDIDPDNSELQLAKQLGILMTWQEFMGKYIQKDKKVITIAGTHGKSTTTVMMGVVLETAGVNPWVEAGTIYKPWGSGARVGDSDYFVCEADEFNNNYHNYTPEIAIINNIEMDHPEFFNNFIEVKKSFAKHILSLKGEKLLIVNEESQGIREVLLENKSEIFNKGIRVIGYYIDKRFDFPFYKEYKCNVLECKNEKTIFEMAYKCTNEVFELDLKGIHNVYNSLGVIAASEALNLDANKVKEALENYEGIGRRGELVKKIGDIMIFDDYAHHPTAADATIKAFKQTYESRKIITIIEPHQISRVNMFRDEFIDALKNSDKVVITKVFEGREKNKNLKLIDMNAIASDIGDEKAVYIEDFDDVAQYVKKIIGKDDIILVLGAGESYKITKKIINELENRE